MRPVGTIRCTGGTGAPFREAAFELTRPDRLALTWDTESAVSFWGYPGVMREEKRLIWPDGTTVTITQGTLASFSPEGYHEVKAVGNNLLNLIDPAPRIYPTFSFQPEAGRLVIQVQ